MAYVPFSIESITLIVYEYFMALSILYNEPFYKNPVFCICTQEEKSNISPRHERIVCCLLMAELAALPEIVGLALPVILVE